MSFLINVTDLVQIMITVTLANDSQQGFIIKAIQYVTSYNSNTILKAHIRVDKKHHNLFTSWTDITDL